MKLFYYVKTTLKGLISNLVVTLAFFLLFPIVLAGTMGFIYDMQEGSQLKLKKVNVQVIDEDKSELSKDLATFLTSAEVGEIVTLVEEKPDVELIINKGYEESVLQLKADNLILRRKTSNLEVSTNTFKILLDNYHKALYMSLSGGQVEQLNSITGQSIIEGVMVDKPEKENHFEKMAVSMLGFAVVMLLYGMLQAGYTDISVNLDRRVNVAPVTKSQFLLYDSVGSFSYSFILISIYVLFFRVVGLTFKGNLLDLFIIIALASIFITAISQSILTVLGPKIGKVVSFIVFILPILGGEIFGVSANALAVATPTYYINNVVKMYIINGNLIGTEKWIGIILGVSAVLFSISIIKILFFKGGKGRCA